MAQHAITAVHYDGARIDLVAIHKVVDKELGSTGLSLDTPERISVGECAALISAGEEIFAVRRTESHAWEIICDVELLPGGNTITGVDIADQPNEALRGLPSWN